jgi:hypothetical protein
VLQRRGGPNGGLISFLVVIAAVGLITSSVVRPISGTILGAFGRGPRQTVFVGRGDRLVPLGIDEAEDLATFLRAIESDVRSGRRLVVGPADLARAVNGVPMLYFLLPELEPATYFLEISPGSANREGTRLAQDLASADLVILTDRYSGWKEPNASRFAGDVDPMRVLRSRFCPTVRFGEWTLLKRCTDLRQEDVRPAARGTHPQVYRIEAAARLIHEGGWSN